MTFSKGGQNAMFWDETRLAELKACLHDGMSATEAASVLSKRFGVRITRNGIIGVAHRRGIPLLFPQGFNGHSHTPAEVPMPKPVTAKRKPAPPPVPAKPPTPAQTVINAMAWALGQQRARMAGECPEAMPPAPNAAPLRDRLGAPDAVAALKRGECKWPVNDPFAADFHFCCATITGPDHSYCSHHLYRSVHG